MTVAPFPHPLALTLFLIAAIALLLTFYPAGTVPILLLVFTPARRAMIAIVPVMVDNHGRAG
jgi:hypothetical protein